MSAAEKVVSELKELKKEENVEVLDFDEDFISTGFKKTIKHDKPTALTKITQNAAFGCIFVIAICYTLFANPTL